MDLISKEQRSDPSDAPDRISGVYEGFTIHKTSTSPEVQGTPITDAIDLAESEQAKAIVDNQVAKAPLLDDSYWRTIVINSEQGTVCSYELLNSSSDMTNNVFEIQISDMQNLEIGLYYGQYTRQEDFGFELQFEPVVNINDEILRKQYGKYSRLVDLNVFKPSDCSSLMHCTSSTFDNDDEDHYI